MSTLILPDAEVIYLPKNLNIEEAIRLHPIAVKQYSKNSNRVIDRIALILGQLFQRLIFNKDLDQNGYISLNAGILEHLTTDYQEILGWALEASIIKTNRHYKPGAYSIGFRFCDSLLKKSRKHYVTDKTLIKKIRNRRINKATKTLPFLYDSLRQIEIDSQGAMGEMERLFIESDRSPAEELKRMSRKAAIESLDEGRFFFKRDAKIGRLHTNITGLKKEARKYLTWQGQELVNIDIKNSQPYFSLALLFSKPFNTLNIPKILSNYNPLITTIMIREYEEMLGSYSKGYVGSVAKGVLYEMIAKKIGIERKEAKEVMFNVLFSIPDWDFRAKKEFVSLFPAVWKLFTSINTGFTRTKSQGRKHDEQSNALALSLQRVESTVILDHIVPVIKEVIPGVPIWTIHDSILSLKTEANNIAHIMKRITKGIIGFEAPIHFD